MAKKKKDRFRFDILAIVLLIILIVFFCAYVMNTSVVDVVEKESDSVVYTHENNYQP